MLEAEIKFFIENQQDLAAKYPGRYLLVKGDTVSGSYQLEMDAISEGVRQYGLSSFLVRHVNQVQHDVCVPALSLGIINAPSDRIA